MRSHKTARFTLLELLAVMSIIFIMAALLVGVTSVVSRNMHEAKTKARMEAMMMALQEHFQDRGYYPQQAPAVAVNFTAFTHTQTGRPYLEGYGPTVGYLDGWERPFLYATADAANVPYPEGYHLWSRGHDKKTFPAVDTSIDNLGTAATAANTADDINSWGKR
jgi:type II secretory pathway pseudopilin PulG